MGCEMGKLFFSTSLTALSTKFAVNFSLSIIRQPPKKILTLELVHVKISASEEALYECRYEGNSDRKPEVVEAHYNDKKSRKCSSAIQGK